MAREWHGEQASGTFSASPATTEPLVTAIGGRREADL
jgi:hypothetical protein